MTFKKRVSNFVPFTELLDELMDYGYPQTTEIRNSSSMESHKLVIAPRPPPAVTNAVSWRKEGKLVSCLILGLKTRFSLNRSKLKWITVVTTGK